MSSISLNCLLLSEQCGNLGNLRKSRDRPYFSPDLNQPRLRNCCHEVFESVEEHLDGDHDEEHASESFYVKGASFAELFEVSC